MVQTVPECVPLTVNQTHVDTRTDRVLVLQVGWVIIVLRVSRLFMFIYFLKDTDDLKVMVMSMVF